MTVFQVRDPAVDADDQWTRFERNGTTNVKKMKEWVAAEFRRRRNLPETHPVEVMNQFGASVLLPTGSEPVPLPEKPVEQEPRESPNGKRPRRYQGHGQKKIHIAALKRHLARRPLTINDLLRAEFGPEMLPIILRAIAFRGTVFAAAREGTVGKSGDEYYLLAERS